MSFFKGYMYEWKPSANACAQCLARPLLNVTKPGKPHKHCKCKIKKEPLLEKKLESYSRTLINSTSHEELITMVIPGNCIEVEHTTSATSTNSWEVSAGFEGKGISVGGSVGNESTNEQSTTVKQKFCHGGVCENSTEYIFATYETDTYLITKIYRIKTLSVPVSMSIVENTYEYEMTQTDIKVRCEQ
ncbi:hypothetical protein [Thalassotalea atypica]|uniref:hypothetical protein n=1 Tax=Thalassotalea atypica TaxID=2054316 RepID=UPI00257427E0|nr:hypothetical protein [Thalassotalea atypica]